MKCRRPAFVRLLWAGIGAAVADSGGELGDEFLNALGFLGAQVGLFAGIVSQIEELHRRQFLILQRLRGARRTPTAGARAEDEFPRAATDGEGAVDGMMDGKRPQRLAMCLALQYW